MPDRWEYADPLIGRWTLIQDVTGKTIGGPGVILHVSTMKHRQRLFLVDREGWYPGTCLKLLAVDDPRTRLLAAIFRNKVPLRWNLVASKRKEGGADA